MPMKPSSIGPSGRLVSQRVLAGAKIHPAIRSARREDRALIMKLLPSIFHDLSGITGALQNYFQLIEHRGPEGYSSTAEMWKDVERMRGAAAEANAIGQAVIAFLIDGRDQLKIHYLHDTLRQYELIFRKYFTEQQSIISFDYQGLIRSEDVVKMRGRDLHTILTDLIKGAADACGPGSAVNISFSAEKPGPGKIFYRITVAETGPVRSHPLIPRTVDLVKDYGGRVEVTEHEVSIYLPKA
jgi:hypothetical protein